MEPISICCPGCGADLPPEAPHAQYRCSYCGRQFALRQVTKAKTRAGQDVRVADIVRELKRVQPPPAAPKSRAPAVVLFILVAMLIAGAGFGVFMFGTMGSKGFGALTRGLAAIEHEQEREHLMWDRYAGPPAIGQVGDREVIVGRTRTPRAGDELFIDCFDATSQERKWRVGPLGTYSQGYQHTHYAVVAKRVAISDYAGHVFVHELDTGKRLFETQVSDRVDYFCRPPSVAASEPTLWVAQVDKRKFSLNVETFESREGDWPSSCPETKWEAHRLLEEGHPPTGAPAIAGLRHVGVWTDGTQFVSWAVKDPGTPVPHLVGFKLEAPTPLFDVSLPTVPLPAVRNTSPVLTVAGGRAYAVYGTGTDGWRLACLDATTGTRIWESALRPLFSVDTVETVVATAQHVYLPRSSSVEIYRADTGKLLGVIGEETYEDE